MFHSIYFGGKITPFDRVLISGKNGQENDRFASFGLDKMTLVIRDAVSRSFNSKYNLFADDSKGSWEKFF